MIERTGAKVIVHGEQWSAADKHAREILEKDNTLQYIHPFDHKDVFTGNSSLVDEIKEQMGGKKPKAIILSVGGGGLMAGVGIGLSVSSIKIFQHLLILFAHRKRNGWQDVPIVAVETHGAHSLNESIKQGKSLPNFAADF